MSTVRRTSSPSPREDPADWRWRAVRLAHEVERTIEIKRARGAELDPLDERLEELALAMFGPVE